jgi:hypothetical protein
VDPTFNTIYTRYSDEVARLADSIEIESDTSPSLSGGDDYDPETLVDDNPAKVAKIESTTGAWHFTYSEKQPVALVALIHHTFDESAIESPNANVRIEANDTGTFGAPAFAADIPIPPWLGVGTGSWPQNPWIDLTAVSGYDPDGWLHYWLIIENNSQNIQLGQVIFSPVIRQFDPDLRWGLRHTADKPQIENRTSFGISTLYPRGTTIWTAEADILLTDDMRADLESHWYDVEGRARPFVIVPSGPVRSDRCYLVRYTMTDEQVQWNSHEILAQRLSFQEVGRGLRPGV